MPRLQKWGSFFLPRKQKSLSLSFSRAQNTQPRAYARRTSLFRFTRMKKPLSDLSLLLRKSAFERVYKFYSTLFCKNTSCFSLFPFAWKNEAFCPRAFSSSFFNSFFFVESSRFGSSFSPPAALTEWMLFSKREDEKVESTPPTPSSLFDCFCGKTLFFRFVLLNHTITFPYSLYSSSFSEDALA